MMTGGKGTRCRRIQFLMVAYQSGPIDGSYISLEWYKNSVSGNLLFFFVPQ